MGDAKYRGTMLHYCQKMMAGEVPIPPVAQLIGMELAAVRPGRVVIELEAGTRHTSPLGTVHGGVLGAIADAAMGLAYATMLKEAETFATIELKINFLRPVWEGRLRAEGKVVSSGRNLGLVECDVTEGVTGAVARQERHRFENAVEVNIKFCFQCNQLKFQFADNPYLFNRKPITENRKRYNPPPGNPRSTWADT